MSRSLIRVHPPTIPLATPTAKCGYCQRIVNVLPNGNMIWHFRKLGEATSCPGSYMRPSR